LRESADTKAKRYLVEGRVIITRVSDRVVHAKVRGDGRLYDVTFTGYWSCPCEVRTDRCAHLRAVRMVTAPEVVRGV
jgi:hypothetical protein